jgi:NDP-sugar pyrophosphorylase family protein
VLTSGLHGSRAIVKAVILAGGEGTRLRPLTLGVPKPVVPVVDRPFLRHQLDLLAGVGVREVVFSVAYQPERVRAAFGDGASLGFRIHYAVEDTPLGTGGAVKNAEPFLDDTTVVFNGDVLTDVDLPRVVAEHRASGARATLVLAPVPNPAAYGLVETDADGRVRRFTEKPDPSQIAANTINAGIYVLATETLGRMPRGEKHSIERSFFPGLLADGALVRAYVHDGYWIDIGTPQKYLQVHRDVLGRRFQVPLAGTARDGGWVHPCAVVAEGCRLQGPFYVGPGCRVAAGATLGPDATLTAEVQVAEGARVSDAVVWAGTVIGAEALVEGALLAAGVRLAPRVRVGPGAVLGEGTWLSEFSRT